jgi:hypothetical protein
LADEKQSFTAGESAISCYRRSWRALVTCTFFQAPSSFRVFFCKSSSKKYTAAFYCCSWACPHNISETGNRGDPILKSRREQTDKSKIEEQFEHLIVTCMLQDLQQQHVQY